MALYDSIGVAYDRTRSADPYITKRLYSYLRPNSLDLDRPYLDVGCGTGNYAVALSNKDMNIVGVDQSRLMIEAALRKSQNNNHLSWTIGSAESLPLSDGIFAGVFCTLAIHHFADLGRAFNEVFRVLQNGRFVIFTCTPEQLRTYWIGHYFPAVIDAIISYMPTLERVLFLMRESGFRLVTVEPYEVQSDLIDHFLYSKKMTPAAYLDPAFRAGMSVFAAKVDPREVERGCALLEDDLASGKILGIQEEYLSTIGDYLFVVSEK